jgi:hypothetical protein
LPTSDDRDLGKAEPGKRISHPGYFPIYFHCEVPETVFSAREMDSFVEQLKSETSDAARRDIFERKLHSLEDGSIRHYDFIHKLCLRLASMPVDVARAVALAIAQNAADLGDDFLVSERRRALGGVFAVAAQLAGSDEVTAFTSECIRNSNSDLFAARLYKFTTTDKSKNQVLREFTHVYDATIQSAFTDRMAGSV